MTNRNFLTAAFAAALVGPLWLAAPTTARADDDRDTSVWVRGHYEDRRQTREVPAEERREWVPPEYKDVTIPAETKRVRVPPQVERVRVMERTWVPPVMERYWQHGYFDLSGWNPAHWETRVLTPGHYEERPTDRYEDKVVTPERWETQVVTPPRTERVQIAEGYWRNVIVQPSRVETTYEKVWIPGHWERR